MTISRMLLSALVLALLLSCQEPVLNVPQQDLTQPSDPIAEEPAATEAAQLAGIISDQLSGALLDNAQVRVDTARAHSDAAGFYLFDHLSVGEVKLIVQHPGYFPHTRTLQLNAGRQTVDIALLPLTAEQTPATSSPSAQPTASPSPTVPIILNPDGSISAPTPIPTPSASASATPAPTATPEASTSPAINPNNSAYDPELERAAQAQAVVRRHTQGLQLQFLINRSNGMPVNWGWGQVKVEYYLANLENNGELGQFLTSGSSVLLSNGDGFVVSNLSHNPNEHIRINFTLSLPDQRKLTHEQTVTLRE